jgi:hypothetical protein
MVTRMLEAAFDAHDAARLPQFWAGMLGRALVEDAGGVLLPGEDTQLSLRFVRSLADQPHAPSPDQRQPGRPAAGGGDGIEARRGAPRRRTETR